MLQAVGDQAKRHPVADVGRGPVSPGPGGAAFAAGWDVAGARSIRCHPQTVGPGLNNVRALVVSHVKPAAGDHPEPLQRLSIEPALAFAGSGVA